MTTTSALEYIIFCQNNTAVLKVGEGDKDEDVGEVSLNLGVVAVLLHYVPDSSQFGLNHWIVPQNEIL